MKSKENLSRAEKHFINALLELMREKPFPEITVQELAQKADYDRRTYYRYFITKEDILRLYCSHILNEMASILTEKGPLTLRSGIISYFEFWEQHLDFLTLLEKNQLLYFLSDHQDELIYNYVGRTVQPEIPEQLEKASALSRYSFYFTSGGLWNVLVWWIREPKQHTPKDLADYILTFFKQMEQFH